MDFLDIIHTRRSIRKFACDPVSPELIEKILRAGMASPTATNSQSWRFIIVDNRDTLNEIAYSPLCKTCRRCTSCHCSLRGYKRGACPGILATGRGCSGADNDAGRSFSGAGQSVVRHSSAYRKRRRLYQAARDSRQCASFRATYHRISPAAVHA